MLPETVAFVQLAAHEASVQRGKPTFLNAGRHYIATLAGGYSLPEKAAAQGGENTESADDGTDGVSERAHGLPRLTNAPRTKRVALVWP